MSNSSIKINHPGVFEEAREAIIKLETLSRVLTPAELETLEILFDKHATAIIATSLQEAQRGKYESRADALSCQEGHMSDSAKSTRSRSGYGASGSYPG